MKPLYCTLHSIYITLKYVYGFKGDHLKMKDIYMDFAVSHVPVAIALSLFISKSSNLNKINDASYPNLSCRNVKLLIAHNFKLLSPAQLQSGQKY